MRHKYIWADGYMKRDCDLSIAGPPPAADVSWSYDFVDCVGCLEGMSQFVRSKRRRIDYEIGTDYAIRSSSTPK